MSPIVPPEHADFKQTSAEELAELLKNKDAGKVVVLDVRDAEEAEVGRIKGSVLVPAKQVKAADGDTSKVDEFIAQHAAGASKVVVHCMHSQQRGPTAAKALAARIAALAEAQGGLQGDGNAPAAPEVSFLPGGAAHFIEKFQGDGDLVDLPEGGWKAPQQH